jgi:hypothetical protein
MNINLVMHCYETFDNELGMMPHREAVAAIYQHEDESDQSFKVRTNNIIVRLSAITEGERMKELDMVIPRWATSATLDRKLYDGYLELESVEIIDA